jgi:membrane associated rhomboid family serine protease
MLPFRDINPTRNFPLVTVSLIAANTLIFLYMFSLQQESQHALAAFINRAALFPAAITSTYRPPGALDPIWLSIFTSMFLHGGWLHLAGNMLYLWIFGNNVEDAMGPFRYILFYLLCGLVAALAQIVLTPADAARTPMLGASGAIAGVLGGYLVRYPRAQVETCVFFFIITVVRLPALIVLGFWFILQLAQGVASLGVPHQTGGVAVWAHVGGFLAGMIFINFFAKRDHSRYNTWY